MTRFQIEDLLAQDASGVVFRALDTETGLPVTVRRFFPFGADGGGLSAEEQAAYDLAATRLSEISHPALRSVICGGCDPVDGMPYLATEWIDGASLADIVTTGSLTEKTAAQIITKVLEVCELLSELFADEAIWIDTDIKTFIVAPEDRGITFWISPLKWLGRNETQRGMDSIVRLATNIMGWRGKAASELPQGALANWLNWLRVAAGTATLRETRTRLASCVAGNQPVASRATVRPPARTGKVVKKKKKSKMPAVLMSLLLLTAIGVGGWQTIRWRNQKLADKASTAIELPADAPEIVKRGSSKPTASAASETDDSDAVPETERSPEEVNRRLRELSEQAAKSSVEKAAEAAHIDQDVSKRGGVFTPKDQDLLIAQSGKEVALEGVIQEIGYSKSKKTMYLLFSKGTGGSDPRGGISVGGAPADLTENALTPLVGKKIRLRGKVTVDDVGKGRPVIMIGNRKAIESIE